MCELNKKCGPCSLKEAKKVIKENWKKRGNGYFFSNKIGEVTFYKVGNRWDYKLVYNTLGIPGQKESFLNSELPPKYNRYFDTESLPEMDFIVGKLLDGDNIFESKTIKTSSKPIKEDINTFNTAPKNIPDERQKLKELRNFLEEEGIIGYTNAIHNIMMGRDEDFTPDQLGDYLADPDGDGFGIFGYTRAIQSIYDNDELTEDTRTVGPKINTSREPTLSGFKAVFPQTEPAAAATKVYEIVQSLGTDKNFQPNWSNKIIIKRGESVIFKANFDYTSNYQVDKNWGAYGNIFIDMTLPNSKEIMKQIKNSAAGLNESYAHGDRVLLSLKSKLLPGYYDRPANAPGMHVIRLDNGGVEWVPESQFGTEEEWKEQKRKNRQAAGKDGAKTRMADQIYQWKIELKDLQRELRDIYRDQEEEVGGLQGGTDEFEATGRHNEYGNMIEKKEKEIEMIKNKLRKYDELDESIIKEDVMTPPVEMQRKENVKYKDPYFVNLVWTVIQSMPNISSGELWKRFLHNGLSDEYLGDTRTFAALLDFMRSKGYIKPGTPIPGSKKSTAWVVGTKPVYTVNAQNNTGKLKEGLIDKILKEAKTKFK